VELLLRREAYDRVADVVLGTGEVLHAPYLIDAEITQVFRRLESAGALRAPRASEAFDDLHALRLVRHSHLPLLGRVWTLRANLSAYDGLYVALAESMESPLVTLDERLVHAPGHTAEVWIP
jgi:predicted nucleic acid-binding protein